MLRSSLLLCLKIIKKICLHSHGAINKAIKVHREVLLPLCPPSASPLPAEEWLPLVCIYFFRFHYANTNTQSLPLPTLHTKGVACFSADQSNQSSASWWEHLSMTADTPSTKLSLPASKRRPRKSGTVYSEIQIHSIRPAGTGDFYTCIMTQAGTDSGISRGLKPPWAAVPSPVERGITHRACMESQKGREVVLLGSSPHARPLL